jgi:ABC-type transporter MlaC component
LTDTLFDAYTTGLGGYDGEILKIPDEMQLINPKLAVLDCRLSRPSGEDLPVQFTFGLSGGNYWLMENVSIAGVNIGLLLRDQFNSLVQSTGSVAGAIDSWSFESVSAN